ncbi:MAG: hypothetical protein QNJ46_13335 [Leptolyngbyaceae cyanobacterium MO_188.B28]|nr:hypothetical protein [Leptolyngbyaceae cyanobacterium MO_188.B28]
MTWFRQDQRDLAMSVIYLFGSVLLLPALFTYCVGCAFGCLAIAVAGKLFPEAPSPKAELS